MIRAVLTDIEGTTSSLSFVKDVLFPYARAHMAEFVREHAEASEVREQLAAISREAGRELTLDEAIDQLIAWIDADKKITPLKALQGLLWQRGYENGDFKGHVYADAVAVMRDWQARGIRLYVYSSGSVYAQKLLFGHTEYGDLNDLFSGYFDTRIGAKTEAAAYRHIVDTLELPPAQILFLSDIERELDAAREAGMQTCRLTREAAPDARAAHVQVADFRVIDQAMALQ